MKKIVLVNNFIASCLKGFSLAEVMVTLFIISLLMSVLLPVMTKATMSKTGLDANAVACVTNNADGIGYNTVTGDITTMPAKGTPCYGAVVGCQYNQGKACETLTWKADHGTESQKNAAKIVLRAVCDLGGKTACDYFVKQCTQSGSSSSPYCDLKDPVTHADVFFDVSYYLYLPSNSKNPGSLYLQSLLQSYFNYGVQNIVPEVINDCVNKPDSVACNLFNSIAIIQNCNNGIIDSCNIANKKNLNRGCTDIKKEMPNAITGTYKLTPNGGNNPVSTYCDMTSMASAAITGCNAGNAYDCAYGYNNNINHSCAQIKQTWPAYPASSQYNLTTSATTWITKPCLPEPDDPECGAVTIGSIKVSKCNNNIYQLAYNTTSQTSGCWKGTPPNDSCSGTGCDSARTLCTHDAAIEACEELNKGKEYGEKNWRLPTNAELANFGANKTSLDLCSATKDSNPACDFYGGCKGSMINGCNPYILWSGDLSGSYSYGSNYYEYALNAGSWQGPGADASNFAFSVRCVRSL